MTSYNQSITVNVTHNKKEWDNDQYHTEIYITAPKNYQGDLKEVILTLANLIGYMHLDTTVPVVAEYYIRYRIYDTSTDTLDAIKAMLKSYCKVHKIKFSQAKAPR